MLKRVIIMAGGTGGHVFPGLALAHDLQKKGIEVAWLGTEQGLEARLVPIRQIPLYFISISGIRGKGFKTWLLAPQKILSAIFQARKIIQAFKPDVVIGMGGFASGPGGIASWLMRCPLVIHEQNAKAGMTNQWLARLAKKVLMGFPASFKLTPKTLYTGNPVRETILALPAPERRHRHYGKPFNLLVIGGSLGAQSLNQLVPAALALLAKKESLHVRHQSGEKHFATTNKRYGELAVPVQITPFIDDMAEAYFEADLVICRAGALTVAELCAAGVGAIFVPYPFAVDDHQTLNASFMVNHQAAICLPQATLTASKLATQIQFYLDHPEKAAAMAKAAYQLRQTEVLEKMVMAISSV